MVRGMGAGAVTHSIEGARDSSRAFRRCYGLAFTSRLVLSDGVGRGVRCSDVSYLAGKRRAVTCLCARS